MPTAIRLWTILPPSTTGSTWKSFPFVATPGSYLLYFGRIHPDKGTAEAIEIARIFGMPLVDRRNRPGPAIF